MDKLDFATGKQAIKEIISISDQLKAAVAVSEKLAEDLDASTKKYSELSENISNIEQSLVSHVDQKLDGTSKALEKTIELTFVEKFSELSTRFRDLTDQQAKQTESVNSSIESISKFSAELGKRVDNLTNDFHSLSSKITKYLALIIALNVAATATLVYFFLQ